MNEPPNPEVAVFAAAVELPADQRGAYLDQACAGDVALRRQVEALLQVHDDAGNFFDKLSSVARPTSAEAEMPGSSGANRFPESPAEKPGDQIGRYKLLQQIGEGGCGVVYMAEQEEPVRRRVALKVIKLGMDTKNVIARFEAERQALALMDHPNIARVLEAGATETGRPYFVMELVRGVKITDYCNENSLSTVARLELFIRVCQAVQHAHQKGIIHRDIKPSNILVADHDGKPVPKIIDFGIAKATTDQRLTDKTLFTAFEQFIGTPAYMSPEQARLSGLDIDTRSDIYSLGVLLYELLMGKTPFESDRLLEAGLDEIRRIIREEEPLRPSTRLQALDAAEQTTVARHRQTDPPKLAYLIRGDLDWIVMKCLEKDRARRYETANGLAAEIQRHLSNEPVNARPPSRLYRLQKSIRRNKLIFLAAGVVTAALIIGIGVATWMFFREQQARRQAQAEKQRAQAEASKSRQVAQFLEDMLNGIGPSVAQGLDTALLKKVLDNTAKQVGTGLGKQPEVEAELRYTLGEVYWQLGDLTNAEAMHREALSIRTNVLGNKDPQVAQSMRRLAHVLWRRGRLDEADKMAHAGVAMQRELFGSTNLEVAESLEDLSAIFNTENHLDEAEKAVRESLAIKEALLGHDNLEVADVLQDLAAILARKGKAAGAADSEALAIRTKLLGAENPMVIIESLRIHANELESQGKVGEEEVTLNNLVAAQRKLFGNEHPDVARSLNRLALVLRREGNLAQSEAIRREALVMQRKFLGEENAEVAQTLSSLGDVLTVENKLPEAESMHREALSVRRKVFGRGNQNTASSLVRLGGVLEREGKLDEARSLYLEAAEGTNATAVAAQSSLAVMYQSGTGVQRDPSAAAKWFRKSAEFGNRGAQCTLGLLYFEGSGVPKDEVASARWYGKAADQGDGLAENVLGWMYAAGRGVPKDMEQSVKWLTASTDQGNTDFQTGLSQLYKSDHDAEQAHRVELELCTNLLKPDWKEHLSGGQISASSDNLTKLGHLQWHLGQVLSDQNQPAEAEQLFLRALQIFETGSQAFPREPFLRQEQAFSHRQHGDVLEKLDRVSDAESDYRAAIALYAGLNDTVPKSPFYSQEEGYTTWMLAEMLQRANRPDAAEIEYRQAITLHEKASADFPDEAVLTERLGTIKVRLAELLSQRGRLVEAAATAREALDTTLKMMGQDSANLPALLRQEAQTLDRLGKESEAEKLFSDSIKAASLFLGETNVIMGELLHDYGEFLNHHGNMAGAAENYLRSLPIRRTQNNDDLAWTLRNLGGVLNQLGRYQEAEGYLQESVALCLKLHPQGDMYGTGWAGATLGYALWEQRKLPEAERTYRDALSVYTKLGAVGTEEYSDAVGILLNVLKEENKLAEGEAVCREILVQQRAVLTNDNPTVAQNLFRLANLLQAQNKSEEATRRYHEAMNVLSNAPPQSNAAGWMNEAAWEFVMADKPSSGDAAMAVELAQKATQASQSQNDLILDTLAAAYAMGGQFTNAVRAEQGAIALAKDDNQKSDDTSRLRLYESNRPYRDRDQLAVRAMALLDEGKFAEAEPLARECLALREIMIPDDWRTFNAQSMLGGSLLGQKKYAEAEPLLLSGYEGLKQRADKIPAAGSKRPQEALQRLVQLYEETNRPDQAAQWEKKFAESERDKK